MGVCFSFLIEELLENSITESGKTFTHVRALNAICLLISQIQDASFLQTKRVELHSPQRRLQPI